MKCFLGLLLCALATPCCAFISAETENNNTESTANGPAGPATAISGSMASVSDIDWFFLDLPAAGVIDINLNHASGKDFDWALYAATGPALATGATSAIPQTGSYTATASGRYFVKVTAYRGSGSYTLDVSYATGGGGSSCGSGARPSKPSNLQTWIVGDALNASRTPVGGPAMLLMGGGAEVDSAFAQRAFVVANGGDVVILRTTGTDGYNAYLYNLVNGSLKPNSVETLLVDTATKANSTYVEWTLCNAELIFMAGGDQSAYLNAWKDTRVESATRTAYERGGVIGGLSAGLAVQGQYIYDPDGVTAATSAEALANPYRSSMLFSTGFLDLPLMQGIITDTHFAPRDRMGRLLAFMARLRQDGTATSIVGLGIDEATSMFIDRNGIGYVDGTGAAYVLHEESDTVRTQVSSGLPLVYRNVKRTKLIAGQRFTFADRTHTGTRINLSVDARATPPLSPANPY
jgi:cyanophycinase